MANIYGFGVNNMSGVLIEQTTSEEQIDPIPLPLVLSDRVFVTRTNPTTNKKVTYKSDLETVLGFLAENLEDVDLSGYVTIASIVNTLTSTSTNAPASANTVKTLKDLLDALVNMIGASSGAGIAPLLNGIIPSQFLPSFVDDALEFDNLAAFPVTGEQGKIYIAKNTNLIYRWASSIYVLIGDGTSVDVIGVGAVAFARYDQAQSLSDSAKLQHHINVGTFKPKNINVSDNYVFSAPHNNGQTVIRIDSADSKTATINNLLTTSVTIRRVGTGALSLVEDDLTLNGNLIFDAVHSSKTIVYVSPGVYDVYG
jgi:hypothetical protein